MRRYVCDMRHSSTANALFSRLRQRLLATLLLTPDKSWYASQLAAHLAVRRSSLQRDLKRLSAAGILKMSRDGNRAYFQPDESCPIFPELRSLLLKTTGLVRVKRREPSQRASQTNAASVSGPDAGGADDSASDIDFLVIGKSD
jgi:DNA-binding transcriptional ArsR family regulator